MVQELNRIYLIGGPGAGKTYLGKKLSNEFKLPFFELDDIYWDNSEGRDGKSFPKQVRDKNFKKIIDKNKWVVDGAYTKWVAYGLNKADIIIFLKVPYLKRSYRLIKRYINDEKREPLKSFLKFLLWNTKYNKDKYSDIRNYKPNVFSSADEAYEWILKEVKR